MDNLEERLRRYSHRPELFDDYDEPVALKMALAVARSAVAEAVAVERAAWIAFVREHAWCQECGIGQDVHAFLAARREGEQ